LCVGDQVIELIVQPDDGVDEFNAPVVSGAFSITGAVTLTDAAVTETGFIVSVPAVAY